MDSFSLAVEAAEYQRKVQENTMLYQDVAERLTEGEWCLTCDGETFIITSAGKEKRCPDCKGSGRTGL